MNRSAFNAVAFNSPQHERGLTWSATTSDAVNLQDVTFGSVSVGILGEFKFGENRLAGAGYPLGTLNVECVYFVERGCTVAKWNDRDRAQRKPQSEA